MKIRSHLLLLVTGALLPLLLLAAALTAYSYWQQRNSLELRQLERVRAMTIALDTELQATIRVLRVLGLSPYLDPGDLEGFTQRLRSVIVTQPLWSALAIGDPEWREVRGVDPAGPTTAPPRLDEAARRRVIATAQPAVSSLVSRDGRHETHIAAPVLRDGQVQHILMVAIDARQWLEFMSQYPAGNSAITTILDQEGRIIARTLDNDRHVGGFPHPVLLQNTRESVEAAFRNPSLEGQELYSAHNRSVRWGWTVATGFPAATVDAALRRSTWLLVGGALLTIGFAVLMAFLFGRRIARPIAALADSARALERGERPPAAPGAPVSEAREAAHAFEAAGTMLAERERALNEALEGEQRARREAEAANRAKDEFLAMLGHELRNPLNALTSAVAVGDHVPPGSDQARRAREIVARQIVALRELVDDLLDVARVTRGKIALKREPLDLGRSVRQVVGAFTASGRLSSHHVAVDCAEAWVCADDTRIEQVVSNLLDNAVKYTPQGGRIDVRVRAEGDAAILEVEDTGTGIDPDLLPRVFDLFSQGERTLDRAQGGLGLGLALARRLVELHEGTVEAHSPGPGRGACFRVRFQRVEAPAQERMPLAANDEGHEAHLRVLIVEDNPDGRETLAMMLAMQGHEVHEAEDGPSGVDRALELHPDAAIVDIGLPGFDGYEVARRLRAANDGQRIRLVALTGYGQEEDRRNAMAAGFDAFMVKPADLDQLSSLLKAA